MPEREGLRLLELRVAALALKEGTSDGSLQCREDAAAICRARRPCITYAPVSMVGWRDGYLRERDHVVSRVFYSDFFGAVEGGAERHHYWHTF